MSPTAVIVRSQSEVATDDIGQISRTTRTIQRITTFDFKNSLSQTVTNDTGRIYELCMISWRRDGWKHTRRVYDKQMDSVR